MKIARHQRLTRRLVRHFISPFKVLSAVGPQAYELELAPPATDLLDGEEEFEVQLVLNHSCGPGKQ